MPGPLTGEDLLEPRFHVRLPEWWVLRIAARSLLLSLLLCSVPWIAPPTTPVDDVSHLPMLLCDLQHEGVMELDGLDPVNVGSAPDDSVEFVFCDGAVPVELVERVLKVGGILAVRLSQDPNVLLRLPPHYLPVYVRRFRSTVVAFRRTRL